MAPRAPVFFVVGVTGSGTSWLRRMLDRHPDVLCRGEGSFFGAERPAGRQPLEQALLESDELRAWAAGSGWTRRGSYEDLALASSALLAGGVMAEALAASGKRIVGDESPLAGGAVASIGRTLPSARVIHVIRDGRDVAVSAVLRSWEDLDRDPEAAARNREEIERRDAYRDSPEGFLGANHSVFGPAGPAQHARAWAEQVAAARRQGAELASDRYLELRSEDLLEDGAGCLARAFAFLGVAASRAQLSRCAEGIDAGSGTGRGAAGWRSVFTDHDAAVFEQVAGRQLRSLGYGTRPAR